MKIASITHRTVLPVTRRACELTLSTLKIHLPGSDTAVNGSIHDNCKIKKQNNPFKEMDVNDAAGKVAISIYKAIDSTTLSERSLPQFYIMNDVNKVGGDTHASLLVKS